MDKNYTTTLSVAEETGEKLKWLAKDDDRSIAGYLRRFVTAYVNEEYDKKHPKSDNQIGTTEPIVECCDTVALDNSPKGTGINTQALNHDKVSKEWSSDVPKVKF